ncbi:MAG: hypothetical protein ACJ8F7_07385 [Gemmataceae bacterium]
MADERFNARPSFRDDLPWTQLFRTFRVALDPRKLLLAAAGILVMAAGWFLLSWACYNLWTKPDKPEALPSNMDIQKKKGVTEVQATEELARMTRERDKDFDESVDRWTQLHYLAGSGETTVTYSDGHTRRVWGGRLRTMPWYEERGPNPYRLVTSPEKPWERGDFAGWFIKHEIPVLIEPLIKFLEPIIYLLNPQTGSFTRIYLLLIIVWTLATWALFGGAITRMAAVELAGKEPVTMRQAVRFTLKRYLSYLCGPLVPFALIAVLVVVSIVFGVIQLIPFVGDIVNGILWPLILLIGLGMALLLVGLVGYPLMYPTISTEGSDTLDALSRSYNYVYQSPWQFIWLSLVAICYGAAVVFFVGFVGSLTVYLGKWGMSNTPGIQSFNRSPEYLFIYTPTSFGWRETLLEGSRGARLTTLQEEELALLRRTEDEKARDPDYESKLKTVRDLKASAEADYNNWLGEFYWYNKVGAALVAFWVTLLFLMVLGFGYSFFWTTSTMIYLLMRRKVDDTDLDEVYLEEEDTVDPFAGPGPTPSTSLPMTTPPAAEKKDLVDLTVRSDKPAPPPPQPAPPPVPAAPPPEPAPAASEPPPAPPAS